MSKGQSLLAILELLTGRRDADGHGLGARRELTRQRIVAASAELLLERGYRDMRVDEVAAAASVSRPTLYAYFESKGHLLIAAMAEEALQQLGAIGPLFDEERPAEDRLRDWARQAILYVVKSPLHARLARDRDPEVLQLLMEHDLARAALGIKPDLDKARLFSGLIQDAFPGAFSKKEAGELASLLRALSHMSPSLLDEQMLFGLSVERLADMLSDLLVDGMRARVSSSPARRRASSSRRKRGGGPQ
jgi:AcrR family transcriptional regulator